MLFGLFQQRQTTYVLTAITISNEFRLSANVAVNENVHKKRHLAACQNRPVSYKAVASNRRVKKGEFERRENS